MATFKRILCVFIAVVTVAGGCFISSACNSEDKKTQDEKYDISIRVKSSNGEIYEFPVGTDEKRVTILYSGSTGRTYWVDAYKLGAQPEGDNDWHYVAGADKSNFTLSVTYCAPGGDEEPWWGSVGEVGDYTVTIDASSEQWKARRIKLFISVPDPFGDLYYGEGGDIPLSLEGGSQKSFRVHSAVNGYFRLSVDDRAVKLVDGANKTLQDGTYLIRLSKDEARPITLLNSLSSAVEFCLSFTELPYITSEQPISGQEGAYAFRFKNDGGDTARYILRCDGRSSTDSARVYDEYGRLECSFRVEDEASLFTFAIAAGQTCYIVCNFPSGADGDCTFTITEDNGSYGWVIMTEGQTADQAFTLENIIYLERGAEYIVYFAEFGGDGKVINTGSGYEVMGDRGVYYYVESQHIVIDSSVAEDVYLVLQPAGYSLAIHFI